MTPSATSSHLKGYQGQSPWLVRWLGVPFLRRPELVVPIEKYKVKYVTDDVAGYAFLTLQVHRGPFRVWRNVVWMFEFARWRECTIRFKALIEAGAERFSAMASPSFKKLCQ